MCTALTAYSALTITPLIPSVTREPDTSLSSALPRRDLPKKNVPFGVTYDKIGTIQRRLAWPLHKDDTLSRSGRPTGLNIYCFCSTGKI
ncbi:hypothetical protein PUNSTDRAFT_63930 [Punctularia strigosozonata HHB-11173 SS5]|uniref:uncharacterized protein n=1 Tax=Punctularia strigosozonata (strain HHB-11173) TaxID=741275 RepID=UPI00044172C5|nr:uncharacterized protein PUNSTDRAFT_63930 [Punctularia strigosozonata HHB-11173 SS5]EIN10168.1 hypothetical protein PUNSTDRAFT_63930 [Punctularia strigosozonata HHB-11173 SS5]